MLPLLPPRSISLSSLAIVVLGGVLGKAPAIAQGTVQTVQDVPPWRWEEVGPIAQTTPQDSLEFS
ncbi:MAG: hypothetical protein AAGF75_10015, partial [Cyanobacteria bacterium P01_H01_bin.130]